jgi:hypothetical protein
VNPVVLPALAELQGLVEAGGSHLQQRVVCEVACELAGGSGRLPVHVITLGNPGSDVPAIGVFGGVHGLERIGAEVALAFLRSLVMRLPWDGVLHRQLESLRMVFMPLVNPAGMALGTRANGRGVDLMRNAPVEAVGRVPFMIGGQRRSAALPWYRGEAGGPMEAESEALCRVVDEELLGRSFSLAIDCHSGFGLRDRIWFPHAHTPAPIEHLPELLALQRILDQALTHHRYVLEPQSRQYLAHGDLWDHLYLRALQRPGQVFLPLTLEMGSWLWVKKNPRQLFSRHGLFNPLIEHRQQRVLRTHVNWLDFMARAVCSYRRWAPLDEAERERLRADAVGRWYRP